MISKSMTRPKLIRIVASPTSLNTFLGEQMQFMSQWYDVVGVASPGQGHEQVRKAGIRTEEIYIARPIRLFSDCVSLFRLYRLFRKEKPTLIHSITPKAGLLSMIAGWLAGVPIRIHSFTGLLFPWRKGLMHLILKTTDRITCLFATHINPEGNGVRQQLLDHHITHKTLTVLGHGNIRGINLSTFSIKGTKAQTRMELGIPADALTFIFVGRVVKDKGIPELIRAFISLSKERNVHLLIAGPQEPELDPLDKATLEEMDQNKSIHVLGPRQNIAELLEASDVFVFPSHREGFPTALLEAQAMSLPCIATDICGCNEIVVHKENGLLIPKEDAAALLSAMQVMTDMPIEKRSQWGRNARTRIEKYFTAEQVNDNLLQFYRSIQS